MAVFLVVNGVEYELAASNASDEATLLRDAEVLAFWLAGGEPAPPKDLYDVTGKDWHADARLFVNRDNVVTAFAYRTGKPKKYKTFEG